MLSMISITRDSSSVFKVPAVMFDVSIAYVAFYIYVIHCASHGGVANFFERSFSVKKP